MLEAGIVSLVMADAGVLAITTTDGFLVTLPKDETLPSWTHLTVSDAGPYTLGGAHGFVTRRLQIDCFGSQRADAISLAKAIDAVLSGYRGTLSDDDSTVVYGCFRSDRMDFPFDDASRTYRRMLEYEIQYADQ